MKKRKTILEKELDKTKRIFNKFIRERDSAKSVSGQKIVTCICCGKMWVLETTQDKKDYHAGHYWREDKFASVRFDERNVNGCCVHCNKHLHGNLAEYQIHLVEKIGQDEFDSLNIKRHTLKHWTIPELKELQEIYKQKLKENK